MKYLLSILLVIISLGLQAQTYPTPPTQQGSKGTLIANQGGLRIDSTMIPPVYTDTTSANTSRTHNYAGAVIRVGNDYYFRSSDVSRWILFSSGGSSNCPPNGIISPPGSVTWSGSGLVFDALAIDYNINCNHYHSPPTTLTLSAADPTNPRIDLIIVDTNNICSVLAGTASANPVAPTVNPLSQLQVTLIYIPAGATTPGGQTATTIYNENIEWTGSSNVSGVNFAYPTNPYSGSVSTYLPSVVDGQYVQWQNGSTLDLTDYPYTKFYVRLNALPIDASRTRLLISYYNSATQVTTSFSVQNGTYGFSATTINSYQLVVLPNYLLTGTAPITFDKIYFQLTGMPTSIQLDKIYLLSGAVIPPQQSNSWLKNGNSGTNPGIDYAGTSDSTDFNLGTNNQPRVVIPANGLQLQPYSDTSKNVILYDTVTHKFYRTKFPTAYGVTPIVIVRDEAASTTYVTCPTCNTGGAQTLQQTIVAGDTTSNFFIHSYLNGYSRKFRPVGSYQYPDSSSIWTEGISTNYVNGADPRPDNVYFFGFNVAPGGGRLNTKDAQMRIGIEDYYQRQGNWNPNESVMEYHNPEVRSVDDTVRRLQSWTINRKTLETLMYQSATTIEFRNVSSPIGTYFASWDSSGHEELKGTDPKYSMANTSGSPNSFVIHNTPAETRIENGVGAIDFKTPTTYDFYKTSGGTVLNAQIAQANSNGAIGIGTTPSYNLDIYGTNSVPQIRIHTDLSSAGGFQVGVARTTSEAYIAQLENANLNLFVNGQTRLGISGAGVLTLPYVAAQHNATDSMMVINASNGTVGFRAIPSSGGGGATLFGLTGTNTATGDVTGDLATHNLNIINGNVGIGTTTPTEKLHVVGNALITGTVKARNVIGSTVNATDADFTAVPGTAYVLPDPSTGRTITFPASPQDADVIRFYVPQALSFNWNTSVTFILVDGTTDTALPPVSAWLEFAYDGANSAWRSNYKP